MGHARQEDAAASSAEAGRYQNETLRRAFLILECLDDAGRGLTAAEVARRTGLHRATVHRFLTNLTEMGYTRREPVRGTFWIGFNLAHFGLKPRIVNRIVHAARPIMRRLATGANCAVTLGSLEGAHVLVNEVIEGSDGPALAFAAGDYVAAAGSAMGRALMALRSDAEALKRCRLSSRTETGATAARALAKELGLARTRGYAASADEAGATGLRSLAVSLINPAGRATCALALIGTAHHLPPPRDAANARSLAEAAAELVATLTAGAATVPAAPVPAAERGRGSRSPVHASAA